MHYYANLCKDRHTYKVVLYALKYLKCKIQRKCVKKRI